MGTFPLLDNGRRCYNSAHHILMGWHRTVTCSGDWCSGALVGVDDAWTDANVNMNLYGRYSVGFNRQKGMHSDTSMFQNQVIIHTLNVETHVVASLSDWQQKVVHNFITTGTTLAVLAHSLNWQTNSVSLFVTRRPLTEVSYFQIFESPSWHKY